jgi:hypothetical protein
MEEIDDKYIDNAINQLFSSKGLKENVDHEKILDLMILRNIKDAVKEIAKYLGLPIEVDLSYVPRGYRPNAGDGFHSTALVKTEWNGQGAAGIIAQVSIPHNLPFYGSLSMVNFPIKVRVSENCADNPMTFIFIMAHELSHILLYSILHKEKENEFYTDLTVMMLGFTEVARQGRQIVKSYKSTSSGILSNTTTTTTNTTSYGYLSNENFNFAINRINNLIIKYCKNKNQLNKKINETQEGISNKKIEISYFKKYLSYLDQNYNKVISEQDRPLISIFHQPDYTDELEMIIKKNVNEIKQILLYFQKINHYGENYLKEVKRIEGRMIAIKVEVDSKWTKVNNAVVILKRYTPMLYRFVYFIKISISRLKKTI